MAVQKLLNDAKVASSGFRVSITPSNRNKNAAILDFHVPPHGISTRVESESLTWEPGRKATVLAHNDFAVEGPGVQCISRGPGRV